LFVDGGFRTSVAVHGESRSTKNSMEHELVNHRVVVTGLGLVHAGSTLEATWVLTNGFDFGGTNIRGVKN
jgi:hypothetical protein